MLKIKLFLIIITALLLASCSSTPSASDFMATRSLDIDPTNLNQLMCVQAETETSTGFFSNFNCKGGNANGGNNQLRVKVLQDTALGLAAQGGLAWASRNINCRLQQQRWYLETIYNFNGMMLSHGVLPPVLVEGNNGINIADPNTIRIADKTYKIIQQARFASTPPNWREYLWMTYPKPEIPSRVLMPRNAEETRIWQRAIQTGWEKGNQQAFSIYHQNLARLRRDYNGMLLYRKLLMQRMVSAPFVSRTELGVTGNGTDMRINDQVLRITELPKLQTDSGCWKAVVVSNNGNQP